MKKIWNKLYNFMLILNKKKESLNKKTLHEKQQHYFNIYVPFILSKIYSYKRKKNYKTKFALGTWTAKLRKLCIQLS